MNKIKKITFSNKVSRKSSSTKEDSWFGLIFPFLAVIFRFSSTMKCQHFNNDSNPLLEAKADIHDSGAKTSN